MAAHTPIPDGTPVRVGEEIGVVVGSRFVGDDVVYSVLLEDGIWEVGAERVRPVTNTWEKVP